ncbi:MAG TPA: hypothetical protein VIT67_16265, partial [Povalibacter sp.]
MSASATASRDTGHSRWSHALYVLPFLVVYVGLLVYPLFRGMWLSLYKADFFGARTFVGLEN